MMATATPERITVGNETLKEAREAGKEDLQNSSLVLRHADGSEQVFPAHLQEVLINTLKALAGSGEVSIGKMPDELTTTVAADAIGVSRPTLMKWAQEGKIDSYKVGSHSRFRHDDVLALKKQRVQAQRDAFTELRTLDAELDEMFED
ncbi:helix-turn-helix domain-containing protein [Yaniella flava]